MSKASKSIEERLSLLEFKVNLILWSQGVILSAIIAAFFMLGK